MATALTNFSNPPVQIGPPALQARAQKNPLQYRPATRSWTRRRRSGGCGRAANGHAAASPSKRDRADSAYGANFPAMFRQAADYVMDRAPPQEWPVSQPFREVTFCASYKSHCLGSCGSRLSWLWVKGCRLG